jgi:DNA-binding CsgD family transcriptional regulator
MLSAPSLLALNDVVSSFYEAAAGHASWEEPLSKAARVMGAHNAVFSVRDPVTRKATFSYGNFGTNHSYVRNFAETYSTLSPFVIAVAVATEGTVINPIELIGRAEYEKGRFFKEWSEPQGYHDYIGSVLLRQSHAIYTIAFGRTRDRPLFNQVDHDKLAFIVPHATRALQIAERLNTIATDRAELLSTLDSLSTPVILVDMECRMRQVNTAALILFDTLQGLENVKGKLRFANSKTDAEFRDYMVKPSSQGIILQSGLDNGMRVHLLTKRIDKNRKMASALDDRVIVVVDWPKSKIVPIGADLRDKYNLTMAELRVLSLMIDGGSVNSVAHDLGLTPNTIKTHIKSMFAKTDTNRQQDLIRVVLDKGNHVPPLKLMARESG